MRIIYNENEKIFVAVSDYSEKDILKDAGFRWNPERRYWYTNKISTALEFKQYFSDSAKQKALEIIKENEEKINKTVENIENQATELKNIIAQSEAIETQSEYPHPDDKNYFNFQKAGIEFMLNHPNTLLGDDMGSGKTVQAIGLINALNATEKKVKDVLIVCPAFVKRVWLSHLNDWLVEKDYKLQIATNEKIEFSDKNIVIINYEGLARSKNISDVENKLAIISETKKNGQVIEFKHPELMRHWDILIVDESHYMKNKKAQRTKAILKLVQFADRRLLLTGTPMPNRPTELFTQLKALNSDIAKSYRDFCNKYVNFSDTRYGRVDSYKNLDMLQIELRKTVMLRRLKKQILPQLPQKLKEIVTLDPHDLSFSEAEIMNFEKVVEEYKKLDEEIEEAEAEGLDLELITNLKRRKYSLEIGEIAKERHILAERKVPAVVQFVKNILEQNGKVVIFGHHQSALELLQQEFKGNSVLLTGSTSLEERDRMINMFQNDDNIKVFIASMHATGLGITLTAAHVAVFLEWDWTPSVITQAEDRLHRIGQNENVNYYYFSVLKTIDDYVLQKIIKKQELIDKTIESKSIENEETTVKIENIVNEKKSELLEKLNKTKNIKDILQNIEATPDAEIEKLKAETHQLHEQSEEILQALRYLVKLDSDYASELNHIGFNKYDSSIAHQMAERKFLTVKQGNWMKKMLYYYRYQLPEEMRKSLWGVANEQ